jgi:peptide/nickel transport system substrate-binding protein
LLADAGYPNGFRVTLHGSNDRFLNDAQIVQAIGQMWTRIGVQTSVVTETWTSYIAHAAKQDFSAFLLSWDSATGEASNPLRLVVATFDAAKGRGAINRERYSNPMLDTLIDRAMVTTNDAAREKLLIEGITMAMADVAVVPLHQQKNTWASRAGLSYVPRVDEHTSVTDLRPSP